MIESLVLKQCSTSCNNVGTLMILFLNDFCLIFIILFSPYVIFMCVVYFIFLFLCLFYVFFNVKPLVHCNDHISFALLLFYLVSYCYFMLFSYYQISSYSQTLSLLFWDFPLQTKHSFNPNMTSSSDFSWLSYSPGRFNHLSAGKSALQMH